MSHIRDDDLRYGEQTHLTEAIQRYGHGLCRKCSLGLTVFFAGNVALRSNHHTINVSL